jgi:hypothetical protein
MIYRCPDRRIEPPRIRDRPAPPDASYAARCFQEFSRRQATCVSLRRAIRHESDRAVKRRLKHVLRRAEVKERKALQAYRQALMTAYKAILAQNQSGRIPPDRT